MRLILPALLVAVTFLATTTRAEVPLLGPAELEKAAKHIVLGTVRNVYTTEKVGDNKYVDTLFAIEVVIGGVEKGETVAANQVIFAKAWQMKKRARGWAGPSGQDQIPKKGQAVKLFLTGANGDYTALSPNGISIVQTKTAK